MIFILGVIMLISGSVFFYIGFIEMTLDNTEYYVKLATMLTGQALTPFGILFIFISIYELRQLQSFKKKDLGW